ncbi:hypothetical protein TNCV_1118051 [Trichonephila clavipes]|nr:hypothetical protein TNCV_1118051 [Trichonephila clavipes]
MSSSQSDFTQSHAYGLKVNDSISKSFIHNETYTKMVGFLRTAVVQTRDFVTRTIVLVGRYLSQCSCKKVQKEKNSHRRNFSINE